VADEQALLRALHRVQPGRRAPAAQGPRASAPEPGTACGCSRGAKSSPTPRTRRTPSSSYAWTARDAWRWFAGAPLGSASCPPGAGTARRTATPPRHSSPGRRPGSETALSLTGDRVSGGHEAPKNAIPSSGSWSPQPTSDMASVRGPSSCSPTSCAGNGWTVLETSMRQATARDCPKRRRDGGSASQLVGCDVEPC
jgi:hypothetical protein